MEHLEYLDLVGVLVGSIMANCHPLQIAIFAQPGGRHTTQVGVADDTDDAYYAAQEITKRFQEAVVGVWYNDSTPGWYYVQFDAKHPPSELYNWDVPIAANGVWMDALAESQGLVGLSISEQKTHTVTLRGKPFAVAPNLPQDQGEVVGP